MKDFPLKLYFYYDNEQGKSNHFIFDSQSPVLPHRQLSLAPFHTTFILGQNDEFIFVDPSTGEARTNIPLYPILDRTTMELAISTQTLFQLLR